MSGRGRGPRGARGSPTPGSRGSSPDTRGRGGPPRGQGRGGFADRGGRGSPDRGAPRGGMPPRGAGRGRGGPAQIPGEGRPAAIDARIAASDRLVASFKTVAPTAENPLRPGYGTLGTPITLRANFFPVKIPKGLIVHDYAITISPKSEIRRVKQRICELLEQHPDFVQYVGNIAHDGGDRLVCLKAC